MTSGERMKRWRENPENRAKENKRHTAWRRAHGMKPHVHLTEEEKIILRRVRARKRYATDPDYRQQRAVYARKYWYTVRKPREQQAKAHELLKDGMVERTQQPAPESKQERQ